MSNELELFNKSTLKKVEERVKEMQEEGSIDFPPNYSPSNSIKSFWLKLQSTTDKNDKPVLETCTKTSIMEAMLETVIQGLNPAKDQVYPVAWGKRLSAQKSYFGRMALAKRVEDIKEIRPSLIYEDDTISLVKDNGREVIKEHETSWDNRQKKIVGAYVVIIFGDDRPDDYTIMTRDEIEQAWAQRPGKDKSRAHKNFSGEMAKKTVINRACKPIYKSSDDASLLVGQPEVDHEQVHERQVEAEKQEEANKEVVDLEPEEEEKFEGNGEPESEDTSEEEDKTESEKQGKLIDDEGSDIEKRPDF